jgi:hypothetical protein
MDISLESDIYEPSIDGHTNNYVDAIPPSHKFKQGIRCPCGTRKDHVFDNRQSFITHSKSKSHIKWIDELNANKMNYFTDCEKLKELVTSQRLIISKLEKELTSKTVIIQKLEKDINTHKQTIVNLANQITVTSSGETTENLLEFD